MKNLEKKIDLLVSLALAEDEETRESLRSELTSVVAAHRAGASSELTLKIAEVLRDLGVPCSVVGYQDLVTAIRLAVETPAVLNHVTYRLYPKVAEIVGGGRTTSQVERGIRHAIELACLRVDPTDLYKYFGNTLSPVKGKPTNSEFLSQITWHLLNEGWGGVQ